MQRRIACALGAMLAACGGASMPSAFSPEWQNDGGRSIAAVEHEVGNQALPVGPGVVVGVTDQGLVGATLDGSSHWTASLQPDAAPAIAGNVVVATGGGRLSAFDAKTGRELWSLSSDGKSLVGAGDDGSTTAVTLASRSGGGSLFLAVDRSGSVVRRLAPEPAIGVPGILGGVAFIPWGNQYVSAVDVQTGDEVGRLLTRTVVSRAVAIGGKLYFGESALIRFDDAIGAATTGQAHEVTLPERELPGKPHWFPSGVQVRRPDASATEKIALAARPAATNGGVDIAGERFIATYFRVVVGLNALDGALRWVRSFPTDIIAASAADGGFALCDDKGTVWLVGAPRGGDAGKVSLGTKLRGCAVNAGGFKVPEGKDAGSLPEQIGKAVEIQATDMVSIQRFLLRELGTNQDPAVTELLIQLAADARTSPALVGDTRKLLASRRTGAEYMLKALERRYDFLSDVLRPPPVGPLADALAAMREQRAAPLLAEQLNEPTLSTDDIQRAAKALVVLATPEEKDALSTFFSLYRAAAGDEHMVAAVISVARALLNVGGEDAVALVQRAADDPLTNPAVKHGISSLLPRSG